jgi:TDG/mug DNA glycosylase family protein
LAECIFSRLRRLHADAGILKANRRIDSTHERTPDRIDVRRSGAVALSSLAHRRRIDRSRNSHRGHHESQAAPASHANSLRARPWQHRYVSGGEFVATEEKNIESKERADAEATMIAYKTSKDARVLFVGINPHPGSYRRGVPFSNNKMFWYLLNRAGLLQETEKDLRNDQSLKTIYENKFLPEYGLNFVNLVDRPTADVTMLKKGEEEAGIRRALKIIRSCKPRVVCFIGKIAFNTFYRTRKCDWGWQTEINGVPVYLMHFPIRGPASVRVEELKELKRASRIK